MFEQTAQTPGIDVQANTMIKTSGQSSGSYTRNRGASVAEQILDEQEKIKVIHTTPSMSDVERLATEKRISADLYDVFVRIQEILNIDSEL